MTTPFLKKLAELDDVPCRADVMGQFLFEHREAIRQLVEAAEGLAQNNFHMRNCNAGFHIECAVCKKSARLKSESDFKKLCWDCRIEEALAAFKGE